MPMKPRELIRILKLNGFVEKSQRGSHLKMYNFETNVTVLIPIHAREMKKGTEKSILKQAGLI